MLWYPFQTDLFQRETIEFVKINRGQDDKTHVCSQNNTEVFINCLYLGMNCKVGSEGWLVIPDNQTYIKILGNMD